MNDTEKDLTDGKLFADAILKAEGELYKTLLNHFVSEMDKARKGRICTPERMAALYPIFREINIEMNEINAYWDRQEIKEARRMAKKEKTSEKN